MLKSSRELQVGQFVKSRAGRDKGKVFIVYEVINDAYVYVVDGDLRKLEKPKKKKVKHLKIEGNLDLNIQEVLLSKVHIENKWLKQKIESRLDLIRVRRDDSNG